jgi:predicted ATPase
MITSIFVDGFKTLVQFRLQLHPGLNILVGPNGSGKTNIVSFFEFLAHLIESDAAEATSRMGGAGAVFRKVHDTYQAKLSAVVLGCYQLDTRHPRIANDTNASQKLRYALYEYGFKLLFANDLESVVFTEQVITS